MTRGLPWWSILLQAPLAGLALLGLIALDYVIATARWAVLAEHSPSSTSSGGSGVIGVLLLPIILGLISLLVGVPMLVWAAIGTLVLILAGLPLRVIPAAGAVWVRYWMPWILGSLGGLAVVVAWITSPVPVEPPRSYLPSSGLFAIGLVLVGFAIAHLWLPRLPRRDRFPRDRELAQSPA